MNLVDSDPIDGSLSSKENMVSRVGFNQDRRQGQSSSVFTHITHMHPDARLKNKVFIVLYSFEVPV